MKNQEQALTSTELLDWIKNAGRELESMETTDRRMQTVINKCKAVGILAHTAMKIDALQIQKYKLGITDNVMDGKPRLLGTTLSGKKHVTKTP
jgi:hypothetical protein